MASSVTPYIPRSAGDLLSAGDWNELQIDIKNDITGQIGKAIGQIETVPHADDADKIDGKTLDQIVQEIIQKVLEALRAKTGNYQRIFKRLEKCQEKFITHGLKACPLVDVYQLCYFPAVCARGETPADQTSTWVNFYLYHATERRIRIPGSPPITVDIEPTDAQVSRLKFSDLLTLYNISFTDTTDLEELEASFWTAFLPNDEFDTAQYCHSPWFEKCCGERRSVKELKDRGDWDRIYLKWAPRKTINLIGSGGTSLTGTQPTQPGQPTGTLVPLQGSLAGLAVASCDNKPNHPQQITAAPTQIQIKHYDFDTLGVRLIDVPIYPEDQVNGVKDSAGNVIIPPLPADFLAEIKVMLLLKV
jgi:hypothetical protein